MCDGIGLGMLLIDHPIKRDNLLKDIPDNKAFYPCADDCAKSHLKWAEALRIRVVFGIRELLRRFWLLLGSKSNEENSKKIFTPFRGFLYKLLSPHSFHK